MADSDNTYSKEFTIHNKRGLHLRPVSLLVKEAMKYPNCNITIAKEGGEPCDGRSPAGLLTLVAPQGTVLIITTSGEGAKEALHALGHIIDNGFSEE